MFAEKKDNNKKNSSSKNYKPANSKKNNLFNLIENNNNNNIEENELNGYSNNNSNVNNNYSNKSKQYDYNQEFLKQRKNNNKNNNTNFLLNNDEEEETDSYNTNNNISEDNQTKYRSKGIFGNFGIRTDGNNELNDYKNINMSNVEVNKYGLYVNISNYETKMSGMQESVFFIINLYSKLSDKSWTVSHKYMDFFELNLIFDKYYVNPPYFPNGTLVGSEGVTDIHHKKTILNQYIKEVCNRSDLMTSIYCVKFLKLENHYPALMSHYPKELYYFKDQLVLPISVSYFYEKANLLFLGCGKEYKTVFNNILDKVKGFSPFSFGSGSSNKQLKLKKNTQVKGQFVIINIIKNFQNKYLFEPLYAQPLYTQCSSINFFKDKSCLTIGMYDGSVNIYKIFINETIPETQGNLVVEAGVFQAHLKPIIGTVVNFINGYIYTMSNENCINIFDINYQNFIKNVPMTVKPMSAMYYDEKTKMLIIGDETGRFYFVDVFQDPVFPSILKTFQGGTSSSINKIYFTNDKETMIASNKTGIVNIYSVYGFNSRNKITVEKNKTIVVSKKYEINDISFTERGELLLAMDNGSVMVYYRDTDNIEFVIDAHLYSIGNIFVIEDKHALISTSEDKSVRMVEFPEFYPAQMIRKEMTNLNHFSIKNKVDNLREKNGYNEKDNEEGDYIRKDNDFNNYNGEMYNERYKYTDIDTSKQFTIMITEPLNKSYKNIFSDDLDGWDDTIEEYS